MAHFVAPICASCKNEYERTGGMDPPTYQAGCQCSPLTPVCPECRAAVYSIVPDIPNQELQHRGEMIEVRDDQGRHLYRENYRAHDCGGW